MSGRCLRPLNQRENSAATAQMVGHFTGLFGLVPSANMTLVETAEGAPNGYAAPGVVFLGAVWALGARRWGASSAEHRRFASLVLGLLGFAFLACLIRTGVYALRLESALYAVPVMLGALACVQAARRLAPYEPDVQRLAWIRFGGYILSGLAFAVSSRWGPAPTSERM